MGFIIGFIVGVGFVISIFSILKNNRKLGIIQLILTFITPSLTYLFCFKKTEFVFGGTDFEFLVQTAFVDRMIEPWFILILYIILIVLILFNLIRIRNH